MGVGGARLWIITKTCFCESFQVCMQNERRLCTYYYCTKLPGVVFISHQPRRNFVFFSFIYEVGWWWGVVRGGPEISFVNGKIEFVSVFVRVTL